MDKLKEEFIKLKCTTNIAGEPILACSHIDFVWAWFSEKLKAEQEKSESFEQQLNDVLNAYKKEILARCTCENCKWLIGDKTAFYMTCKNNLSFAHDIFCKKINEFGCNQFESKEVKNG